jgi:hypothetical protein
MFVREYCPPIRSFSRFVTTNEILGTEYMPPTSKVAKVWHRFGIE